jgi:hypothetical protein
VIDLDGQDDQWVKRWASMEAAAGRSSRELF